MRKILFAFLILLSWIVAACSPPEAATEEPSGGIEQPTPTRAPEERTPPERAAVETLASNLGLPADAIRVVSTEAVDWPDGCLGVEEPGLACTQVITPGFRIILEADGRQVEYRTNEDGTHIRPATVALTWKREGGIAGFCDSLTVYLSGEVHANSCRQGQYAEERLTDLLSRQELAKLEGWLSKYGNLNIDASDPKGVADRMVVMLTFNGTGSQRSLSKPAEQELLSFAQELHLRLYK